MTTEKKHIYTTGTVNVETGDVIVKQDINYFAGKDQSVTRSLVRMFEDTGRRFFDNKIYSGLTLSTSTTIDIAAGVVFIAGRWLTIDTTNITMPADGTYNIIAEIVGVTEANDRDPSSGETVQVIAELVGSYTDSDFQFVIGSVVVSGAAFGTVVNRSNRHVEARYVRPYSTGTQVSILTGSAPNRASAIDFNVGNITPNLDISMPSYTLTADEVIMASGSVTANLTVDELTLTSGTATVFSGTTVDLNSVDINSDLVVDTGATLGVTDFTASRLVSNNGSKNLVSTNLIDWVNGTANQITVTSGSGGDLTLSIPSVQTGATINATVKVASDLYTSFTADTDLTLIANGTGEIIADDNLVVSGTLTTASNLIVSGTTTLGGNINLGNYSVFSGASTLTYGELDVSRLRTEAVSQAEMEILSGATVTTAELNILDGVTSTTTELNKLDGYTGSASELNILHGATMSTAVLNHVTGVTSAIQTQLNGKSATHNGHNTSQIIKPNFDYVRAYSGSITGLAEDSTDKWISWSCDNNESVMIMLEPLLNYNTNSITVYIEASATANTGFKVIRKYASSSESEEIAEATSSVTTSSSGGHTLVGTFTPNGYSQFYMVIRNNSGSIKTYYLRNIIVHHTRT